MSGMAWTPEDKARACAMRGEGKTYQQIADVLGCERERVGGFLGKLRPPKRLRHSAVKQRKCLECGAPFLSEWIGNRLCQHCSSAAAELDSNDYTVIT